MGLHKGRHKTPTRLIAGFPVREIRPGYFCVDYQLDGVRRKKCFSNLDEASVYCEQRKIELRNRGTAALTISDALRADASAAMKVLEPLGVTLLLAAKEYALRHPATAVQTFRQTCDRYLVEMGTAKNRSSSIEDKAGKFTRLCDGLGSLPTAAVDVLDVKQWITSKGYGENTGRAYLGAAKTIMAFYRGTNRKKRMDDEQPAVTWGPEIVAKVLHAAESQAPDIVAALALLFFAGVRPDEVKRLRWDRIDMEGREITLDGSITKTRTMRHVPMQENLTHWLRAYPGTGAVSPSAGRFRKLREKVTAAAGLDGWPTDVPRHSYATALYRTTGSVDTVMSALGHFGKSDVFVNHYKGAPMTAAEAKAYWKIMPKGRRGAVAEK